MSAELEYYKEHVAHRQHIEVQRSTVAGVALTAAGAIVGGLLRIGLQRGNNYRSSSRLPHWASLPGFSLPNYMNVSSYTMQ